MIRYGVLLAILVTGCARYERTVQVQVGAYPIADVQLAQPRSLDLQLTQREGPPFRTLVQNGKGYLDSPPDTVGEQLVVIEVSSAGFRTETVTILYPDLSDPRLLPFGADMSVVVWMTPE